MLSCLGCRSSRTTGRKEKSPITETSPGVILRVAPWTTQVAPLPTPTAPPVKIPEVDEALAATDSLVRGIDGIIEVNFGVLQFVWGCEEMLLLDKPSMRELLYKALQEDHLAGFLSREFITEGGDELHPPYVQIHSKAETFRPYRIVKRQDGRLVLYGHAALYRAKRALERAKNPPVTQKDFTTELVDIGSEGGLLRPTGSELCERVRAIGEALDDAGGMDLMRQVHGTVRERLGAACARELEVAWDDVGEWLG
ncbi:hypothetical protein V494_04853 [Pseudogymnoascus sp. VKM F-4513 (FW-928)]|nr:hypothetical protein V494_04853 [Pseudogymnoascus sp. VKM F-4513 (FW-928)]